MTITAGVVVIVTSGVLASGPDDRNYDIGGGNSLFHQLVFATAPIVALIAVRYLLKALGLADITKFTSALGFMGAAVAKTSGDKELIAKTRTGSDGSSGFSQKLGNLGFNRRVPKMGADGKPLRDANGNPIMTTKRVSLGNADKGNLMTAGAKVGGYIPSKAAKLAHKGSTTSAGSLGDRIAAGSVRRIASRDAALEKGETRSPGASMLDRAAGAVVATGGVKQSAQRRARDFKETVAAYKSAGALVSSGGGEALSPGARRFGELQNAFWDFADNPVEAVGSADFVGGALTAAALLKRKSLDLPNRELGAEVDLDTVVDVSPPQFDTSAASPVRVHPTSGKLLETGNPVRAQIDASVAGLEDQRFAVQVSAENAFQSVSSQVNPSQVSLISDQVRHLAQEELAVAIGVTPGHLVVAPSGLAVPLAGERDASGRMDTEHITDVRALANPLLYLPETPRAPGMSTEDWVEARYAAAFGAGVLTLEGKLVDVFKNISGRDVINNPTDRVYVTEVLAGTRSDARVEQALRYELPTPDASMVSAFIDAAAKDAASRVVADVSNRAWTAIQAVETLGESMSRVTSLVGSGGAPGELPAAFDRLQNQISILADDVAQLSASGRARGEWGSSFEGRSRDTARVLDEFHELLTNAAAQKAVVELTISQVDGSETPLRSADLAESVQEEGRQTRQLLDALMARVLDGDQQATGAILTSLHQMEKAQEEALSNVADKAKEMLDLHEQVLEDMPRVVEAAAKDSAVATVNASDLLRKFGHTSVS